MTILLQVHDEIFQAIAATLKSVLAKSEVWFDFQHRHLENTLGCRYGFVVFELSAHFLQARGERFDLLLLAREGRFLFFGSGDAL
jgi:hypothetical protein